MDQLLYQIYFKKYHTGFFIQLTRPSQNILFKNLSELTQRMHKAVMILHQVREPFPLATRILTEFQQQDPSRLNPQLILARIFLYTPDTVFRGQLRKGDINSQLAWNDNSISTISDCLSGKRTSIDIRFSEISRCMILICEIETGIRVTLFEIYLEILEGDSPLPHMKRVFLGYRQLYAQQQGKAKQQRDRIINEMKQMQALGKQIEQQTQTEIIHMKKNFVDIVNQCKKKLRKHMKTGICELVQEQQEEEETQLRKRTIVRVNREALEKGNKMMEIESEPQVGFQSVFD